MIFFWEMFATSAFEHMLLLTLNFLEPAACIIMLSSEIAGNAGNRKLVLKHEKNEKHMSVCIVFVLLKSHVSFPNSS